MNKQKQKPGIEVEEYQPPEWLTYALQASRDAALVQNSGGEPDQIPDAFRRRCQEAADVALSIARLRNERQRIGFVPLSFGNYIHGLVKVADISLSRVLAWVGIEDLSRPGHASARALARLAQEIGFSLRETLVHLRIGFAERLDSAPIPLMLAHRRTIGSRHSQLEECESVLAQIESDYSPAESMELRRIESEIHSAYEAHEQSPI